MWRETLKSNKNGFPQLKSSSSSWRRSRGGLVRAETKDENNSKPTSEWAPIQFFSVTSVVVLSYYHSSGRSFSFLSLSLSLSLSVSLSLSLSVFVFFLISFSFAWIASLAWIPGLILTSVRISGFLLLQHDPIQLQLASMSSMETGFLCRHDSWRQGRDHSSWCKGQQGSEEGSRRWEEGWCNSGEETRAGLAYGWRLQKVHGKSIDWSCLEDWEETCRGEAPGARQPRTRQFIQRLA